MVGSKMNVSYTRSFDRQLVAAAPLSESDESMLTDWLQGGGFVNPLVACRYLATVLQETLGPWLNDDTAGFLDRFPTQLANLQSMVESDADRRGKFYRDHLDHAVRVSLTARWIAEIATSGDESATRLAALGGLLHDFASLLPASSAVSGIQQAASDVYPGLFRRMLQRFQRVRVEAASSAMLYVGSLGLDLMIDFRQLEERWDELVLNHALQAPYHLQQLAASTEGGAEVLRRFRPALQAIAVHDSAVPLRNPIVAEAWPIIASVIIADELQEWGRPVSGDGGQPALDDLEVRFEPGLIEATFDYRRTQSSHFSVFRLLDAKPRALRRLRFSPEFPALRWHVYLPDMLAIPLTSILRLGHIMGSAPGFGAIAATATASRYAQRYYNPTAYDGYVVNIDHRMANIEVMLSTEDVSDVLLASNVQTGAVHTYYGSGEAFSIYTLDHREDDDLLSPLNTMLDVLDICTNWTIYYAGPYVFNSPLEVVRYFCAGMLAVVGASSVSVDELLAIGLLVALRGKGLLKSDRLFLAIEGS
jgi:hypothetical protein